MKPLNLTSRQMEKLQAILHFAAAEAPLDKDEAEILAQVEEQIRERNALVAGLVMSSLVAEPVERKPALRLVATCEDASCSTCRGGEPCR